MSDSESTVTEERFPFQNSFKNESYIISDVDEELLLLVEFHDFVDLHSIKIHALPISDDTKMNNDDDDDDDDDDENEDEISAPKQVQIFKIDDLSKDFNDIKDMKATHSISCSPKKLAKGQLINLKKKSKIAVKFKKIKYLAVFIKSNQNETDKTYLNGVILSGNCDAKLAYDIPYVAVNNKKKQKYKDIVIMFDKLDRKNVGLARLLKSNQSALDFNISNELIHSLLSYISRLPIKINITTLHKIYSNDDNFGDEWIVNTVKTHEEIKNDDDIIKKLKIESRGLYIDRNDISLQNIKDDDIDYDEKMSFAFMKILCNDDAPKEIKLFLNKKIEFIIFHCMLTFHPLSVGNMYHSVEILKILLKYYPLKLYEILTRSNYNVIQELFKYALLSRIHETKFGEFLLLLLLYNESDKQNIAKYRCELINMLRRWNFLENLIEIGTNPNIYSLDISNKYNAVIATLLKQCATMIETAPLFSGNNNNNMFSLIVEKFLNGALDKNKNDKWYRIHCIEMVIQTITDLSDTKVVEKKRKKIIKSSDNHLYALSNDTLKKLGKYIPLIVNEIIAIDSKDIVYNIKIKKPLGLYRLKCLELFMLYIQLMLDRKNKFKDLGITNINILCQTLIEMAFIHINNNLFLVHFRNFINILDKHCIDNLKYMMIECKMMERFINYYNNNTIPSALKSFVLTILWDINQNSNNNKKWNFALYIKSNQNAKQFMSIVEKQIKLQQPTKV